MKKIIATIISLLALVNTSMAYNKVELIVLGVAQDAGYPQINCFKPHCMPGWENRYLRRTATSLAVIDHKNKRKYLFEATPNMPEQLYELHRYAPDNQYSLAGIFLTHAHMGHYTGLMHLGREAAGSKNVPVFAMPKMKNYLETNGPWSQLVALKNIKLIPLSHKLEQQLGQVNVTPLLVPHRDEFSETVGYLIQGSSKTALFIPDIDKWHKWKTNIADIVKTVDYAFLDATFYDNNELPNRDMSEVPHPFVVESMKAFEYLSAEQKKRIHFIHFNHSNPLLDSSSDEYQHVLSAGFSIASEGLKIVL